MTLLADNRAYAESAMERVTSNPQTATGFVDNFTAALGQVWDNELSISRYINSGQFRERNQQVRDLYASGEISESVVRSFPSKGGRMKRLNYGAIATHLKAKGVDILTDEDLKENRRSTLEFRRKFSENIFERSDGWSGELLGSLVGYVAEPANILGIGFESMAIRSGLRFASMSTSNLVRAAKTSGNVALINMSLEAGFVTPTVWNWREEIGYDMTVTDAVINIVGAGVISGVLTFPGAALGAGRDYYVKNITGKQLARDVREIIKATTDEAKKSGKEIDKEATESLERAANEFEDIGDNKVVDYYEEEEKLYKAINEGRGVDEGDIPTDVMTPEEVETTFKSYLDDDSFDLNMEVPNIEGADPLPIKRMLRDAKRHEEILKGCTDGS